MNFVDEVEIEVTSGKGGDGCVSFRRERHMPKGGPDGGDGGRGASVILRADQQLTTLLDHRYTRHYRAKNGQPGMGKDRFGVSAEDLILRVPVGTLIFDADQDILLGELVNHEGELVVAQGGKGGRGNLHYKSSINQAPRKAEVGQPGQSLRLRMELKLLADVGVVGFPNTGKSTLVSRLSRARPKIADYPFTTLVPTLGMVSLGDHNSFVMADVPGLIEGAHKGAGLGHRFLRHVERCKILVHLVSWEMGEEPDPGQLLKRFDILEREMKLYQTSLADKIRLVAISKLDLPEVRGLVEPVKENLARLGIPVIAISSVNNEGLDDLLRELGKHLKGSDTPT
ncbi:MAG: GTPase ObgE [Deltaproteobacteria bacterium]|nr:GTPase ObgE [Deltaproteobacteria bacterium]